MDKEPSKKYLKLTPEDEAKALARAAQRESVPKVDEEHLLVAEFGMYYGWDAVLAVLNDEIDPSDFAWLLHAARKVDVRKQYNSSSSVFTAVASANAKKPGQTFKRLTSHYLKQMRADA